ncbi:hypothetical protein CTAYLR_006768 [Chrysophaeum taylorii]|uniref:PUB domain-containing protein n=1 Tax=Chrysophaeum taylorii TaxID=2483200 RepID=A0AAD7UBI2_9STRA|nr:hypothetical protein CTAYLR_006768 [Chrysophaeum taylorii]
MSLLFNTGDAALDAALANSLTGRAIPPAETLVEQAALAASAQPEEAIATLRTVLRNFCDEPANPKYRRLRLEKPIVARLWESEVCRAVLESVGWGETRDTNGDRVLALGGDPSLSETALRILEPPSARSPSGTCAVCYRAVSQYYPPPRGAFFRRARSPNEGVVCTTCPPGAYTLCGRCYNHGDFGSHDASHTFAPMGWEEASAMGFRRRQAGARPSDPDLTLDALHGRRGPWG